VICLQNFKTISFNFAAFFITLKFFLSKILTMLISVKDSWKMALRNKFKNVRRVASGPAVAINRRIFGHAAMKRRKRVNTTDHPSLKRKLVCIWSQWFTGNMLEVQSM